MYYYYYYGTLYIILYIYLPSGKGVVNSLFHEPRQSSKKEQPSEILTISHPVLFHQSLCLFTTNFH